MRPSITLLSSWVMVPSWATPPPLSRNDSAPSTSSTSGLRPVAASGMLSPSAEPARRRRPSAGGSRATYFSPSRLTWRMSAIALSGRSTSLRDPHRDLGVPADPLDVGHLADGDVVDHHRRLRDDVEDVLELRGHL